MMFQVINLKVVAMVLSRILFILAIALLGCSGLAVSISEKAFPFFIPAMISMIIGGILYPVGHRLINESNITRKDAYFTVPISWLIISLIGSMPYILSSSIPLFINAFFESVSGFTTTGSSILSDIEALPRSILFWRSLTHWIGGIGIIVLVIVVMPTLQIGGYHLFTLESSLQEKIQPKIKSVGHRLLLIYVGLTFLEVFFLMMGKMNFYESVCHAFGTVATGGFSPKNTSIAGYSPYIQYVIMIFMLLAGTNFVIHYHLLKGRFKKAGSNEEFKFYLSIVLIVGIIATTSIALEMHKPLEESFREAFFQVISIITCTGFATTDYMLWPHHTWLLIFFSMFLGGSTGSTAGGIKMARHLLLLKNIRRKFRHILFPHAVLPVKLNQHTVSEENNNAILTFVVVYLLIFAAGSIFLIATGLDLEIAASSAATCMAGIGPGLGSVGPVGNFAHIPESAKLILSGLMLLGRLEIYTILVLFSGNFWSK
jgi:trk system potassium uptake protein